MSDNKDFRGSQDRDRVDSQDSNEVEYIHRQFPELSHEEVLNVIKQNGPMRENVMNALRERTGRKDSR
jgi:hypothetical protein